MESQLAQNSWPLYPKVAHNPMKVAHNYWPLAFLVCVYIYMYIYIYTSICMYMYMRIPEGYMEPGRWLSALTLFAGVAGPAGGPEVSGTRGSRSYSNNKESNPFPRGSM